MSDKTEQPTERRRQRARREGDSPVSAALARGVGFAVAVGLLPAAVLTLIRYFTQLMRDAIASEPSGVIALGERLPLVVLAICAPLLLASAASSLFVSMVQTGGVVAPRRLSPDLGRVNPLNGLKGVFNVPKAVALLRALLATLLVGWISLRLLLDHAADLSGTVGSVANGALLIATLSRTLLWLAAGIGLGLGALDVLPTRYAWLRRLRMSKDEVKRERRETEGDPELKTARRQVHRDLLLGASLGHVKDATLIISDGSVTATALSYNRYTDDAPRVVCQGRGDFAKQLLDTARVYDVPVFYDSRLARSLQDLDAGDEIPEAHYDSVAEALSRKWQVASVRQ